MASRDTSQRAAGPTISIAINGDLGSGKSSVASLLADSLGARLVSTGAMQRDLATRLGVSTLEVNRRAESDPSIDAKIDATVRSLEGSDELLIIDSRMAWHFLNGVYRVHLIVDPLVGAERVWSGRSSSVERYSSHDVALASIEQRRDSERLRFREKYGVDIGRLSNYDLVIDTSSAAPEAIAERVYEGYREHPSGVDRVLVDPRRILPASDPAFVLGRGVHQVDAADGIFVVYADPHFYCVDGLRPLSDSLAAASELVPVAVVAEGNDPVAGGLSAQEYGPAEICSGWLYAWEEIHGFRFRSTPALLRG